MLTSREKKGACFIFLLSVVGSFVELIGLVTVLPVIGAVLDPSGEGSAAVRYARNFIETNLGQISDDQFIYLLVAIMTLGFVVKLCYAVGFSLIQNRYVFGIALRLKEKMWRWHFGNSLERMRSQTSGRLISEITTWPAQYVRGTLMNTLGVVNDCLVILLIVSGLIVYEPVVFGSLIVLMLLGSMVIRLVTGKRLEQYSSIRAEIDPRMATTLTNAVGGVLELKAFNAVDHIMTKFLRDARLGFRVMANAAVFSALPKKFYELLAVLSVGGAVVYATSTGVDAQFLDTLTVLALASYRVMPAMAGLSQKVMGFRSSLHLLGWMDEVSSLDVEKAEAVSFPTDATGVRFEIDSLELSYQATKIPVLAGLTFRFPERGLVGVVGPSGCGKSTLLNAMLGLHSPDQGKVCLVYDKKVNRDVYGERLASSIWSLVAFLPQHPFLFYGTIEENLDLGGCGAVNREGCERLLERLDLLQLFGADFMKFRLSEGGTNLSGGQRQRLALARALMLDKPILILDEATSALDEDSRNGVLALLREEANAGKLVILVTHDENVASACDEILHLGHYKASI